MQDILRHNTHRFHQYADPTNCGISHRQRVVMDKYLNTGPWFQMLLKPLSKLGFYSVIKGQRLSKLLHETELTVGSINYWHAQMQ